MVPNPYCQRCGAHIPPEEAIPYLDSYGHPIPGQYRNWCIYHWSMRIGALPINHPDFYKPKDARTKRKDKQHLGMHIGHAAMHGRHPERPEAAILGAARDSRFTNTMLTEQLMDPMNVPATTHAPSVSNILARAKGLQSMFPGLEPLGQYLAKHTPEQIDEMMRDVSSSE